MSLCPVRVLLNAISFTVRYFFCCLVPIPTYLLGPTEKQEMKHYASVSLENGGELCENVTYLGEYV